MSEYGRPPQLHGVFNLNFTEYMHYMYLPIQIAEHHGEVRVPRRLLFADSLIEEALWLERGKGWSHVYVTARRGYATPGDPLNRPGWHSDGFGTPDVNYVWTDRFPTLFAEGDFGPISDDHIASIAQFEEAIAQSSNAPVNPGAESAAAITLRTYGDSVLMRLDSSVIHAAPEIPAPGGERSFFKVSFSNDRYDLIGNSHNYLFDYDWPMHSRGSVRNDPASAGADRSVPA